jgi:hypothetical protein
MESIQAQPDTSLKDKLRQSTWKKRVLLVVAPSESDEQLRKQQDILSKEDTGLQDRELDVIYLPLSTIAQGDKAYLMENYNIGQSNFYAILIGKDGSEKLRSASAIDTEKLFGTIDAMPMRRQEMKNE